MEHTPLKSSHIASVGYDLGTLEVKFKDGALYRYEHVPPAVFDTLSQAQSPGRYFHRAVKQYFQGEKIEEKE